MTPQIDRCAVQRAKLLNGDSTMGVKYMAGAWLAALALTATALWPPNATVPPEPPPTEICSSAKAGTIPRLDTAQNPPAAPARQERP